MRQLLPTSLAACLSVVATVVVTVAPTAVFAATYTGSAPAVHMELKNGANAVVCSAYNTPATTAPVATGCPNGTFKEHLFTLGWAPIGSPRTVTIGSTTTTYSFTGTAPAVHMELKNSANAVVCSAYNTPATTAPVATGCPAGTFIQHLFNLNYSTIGSTVSVVVGPGSPTTTGEIRNLEPKFRVYENTASNSLVVNNLTDPVTTFDNGSASITNSKGTLGDGNFRVGCQFSHFSYDDPIIYPGQPGKAHLHMFFGNTKTNANTTKDSLVNSGGGTCHGYELNRSAYWTPALLDGKGNAVLPYIIYIYYKSKITGVTQRMPQGLELIAGNTSGSPSFELTTSHHLFWSCGKNGDINESSTIPKNCGSEPINATIYFAQCWDNKNLKYDKNRPHVFQLKNVDDVCPDAFPYRLPQLGILLYFPPQPNGTAGWRLSSDAVGTATPGGTLHADWIGGWHDATMDRWINNCIKTQRNCTLGQTGTNRTLRRLNGGQPDDWNGPYFMPVPPAPAH